jgi:hypothetical protein
MQGRHKGDRGVERGFRRDEERTETRASAELCRNPSVFPEIALAVPEKSRPFSDDDLPRANILFIYTPYPLCVC